MLSFDVFIYFRGLANGSFLTGISPVLQVPLATSGTSLLFTNCLFCWAVRRLAPAVPGIVPGPGGGGQRTAPEADEPRGAPGAPALTEGVRAPWEHEGASRGPRKPPGLRAAGGGGRKVFPEKARLIRRGSFQRACVFLHTEAINALKQGFGTKLNGAAPRPRRLWPFSRGACSPRLRLCLPPAASGPQIAALARSLWQRVLAVGLQDSFVSFVFRVCRSLQRAACGGPRCISPASMRSRGFSRDLTLRWG